MDNRLFTCFMRKEMHSTHLLDLKDMHKMLLYIFHKSLYYIHITNAYSYAGPALGAICFRVLLNNMETHGQEELGIEPPCDKWPTSSTTWANSGIPIAYFVIYPLLSFICFGNTNVFPCHANKANRYWERKRVLWRRGSHDISDKLRR